MKQNKPVSIIGSLLTILSGHSKFKPIVIMEYKLQEKLILSTVALLHREYHSLQKQPNVASQNYLDYFASYTPKALKTVLNKQGISLNPGQFKDLTKRCLEHFYLEKNMLAAMNDFIDIDPILFANDPG